MQTQNGRAQFSNTLFRFCKYENGRSNFNSLNHNNYLLKSKAKSETYTGL